MHNYNFKIITATNSTTTKQNNSSFKTKRTGNILSLNLNTVFALCIMPPVNAIKLYKIEFLKLHVFT